MMFLFIYSEYTLACSANLLNIDNNGLKSLSLGTFCFIYTCSHIIIIVVTHLSILLQWFGSNAEKMKIETQRLDKMSIHFCSLFSNPI